MKQSKLLSLEVRFEHDVVEARQRARQVSALLGFDLQDQARITTAVSEVARNAFQYAKGGLIDFSLIADTTDYSQALSIVVKDEGPGIDNLDAILNGQHVSQTGSGAGLLGARRLMDQCDIQSVPKKGTVVTLAKRLPRRAKPLRLADIGRITMALSERTPESPFEEIKRQNQELLHAMEALRTREIELANANHALTSTNLELEETNRGVLALYAELDDKAAELRRANELKTRFLSYMSHEFRTPLNSIRGLSQLLLDRADGALTVEQEKQVGFIKEAAVELSEMVNDLLDVAKVESGKTVVEPTEFRVSELLGSLKGMFRPLHTNPEVALIFDNVTDDSLLHTDEAKLAQILRNFVSNALKFTERGEIRVSATINDSKAHFSVADTGIGIATEDQQRIFEEFAQVNSPIQRRVKGTGLGLTLTRKLAQVLGGEVDVHSELGVGSVFSVRLPLVHPSVLAATQRRELVPRKGQQRVLVVDDEAMSRYLLRTLLPDSGYDIIEAAGGVEGVRLAKQYRPDVIFLDYFMPDLDAIAVIRELRTDPHTRDIGIILNTSKILTESERRVLSGLVVAIMSKDHNSREAGKRQVKEALEKLAVS